MIAARVRPGWAEWIALAVAVLTIALFAILLQRSRPAKFVALRLSAPTSYAIDSVIADGVSTPVGAKPFTRIIVAAGSPVVVQGWAVDTPNGESPSSIDVQVDDTKPVAADQIIRDDVARVFGNVAFERSGFYAEIPASALPPGRHLVHLLVGDANGTGHYVAGSVVELDVR